MRRPRNPTLLPCVRVTFVRRAEQTFSFGLRITGNILSHGQCIQLSRSTKISPRWFSISIEQWEKQKVAFPRPTKCPSVDIKYHSMRGWYAYHAKLMTPFGRIQFIHPATSSRLQYKVYPFDCTTQQNAASKDQIGSLFHLLVLFHWWSLLWSGIVFMPLCTRCATLVRRSVTVSHEIPGLSHHNKRGRNYTTLSDHLFSFLLCDVRGSPTPELPQMRPAEFSSYCEQFKKKSEKVFFYFGKRTVRRFFPFDFRFLIRLFSATIVRRNKDARETPYKFRVTAHTRPSPLRAEFGRK